MKRMFQKIFQSSYQTGFFRSRRTKVLYKKLFLKNFAKYWSFFKTLANFFSGEFYEIFLNNFSAENIRATASPFSNVALPLSDPNDLASIWLLEYFYYQTQKTFKMNKYKGQVNFY